MARAVSAVVLPFIGSPLHLRSSISLSFSYRRSRVTDRDVLVGLLDSTPEHATILDDVPDTIDLRTPTTHFDKDIFFPYFITGSVFAASSSMTA